jgi:hypothetical protein
VVPSVTVARSKTENGILIKIFLKHNKESTKVKKQLHFTCQRKYKSFLFISLLQKFIGQIIV